MQFKLIVLQKQLLPHDSKQFRLTGGGGWYIIDCLKTNTGPNHFVTLDRRLETFGLKVYISSSKDHCITHVARMKYVLSI